MDDVVAFMRAFPVRRETLCSEPVMAWLRAKGVDHPFDGRTQRRLFARVGFNNAVREIIARIGFVFELPRNVQPGEPVVARGVNGLAVCGLMGADGRVVMAAHGAFAVAPLDLIFVARDAKCPR